MNTKTAGYLIFYGSFLIVMGLAGYLSNPEKAKTALRSMIPLGDGRWRKELTLPPGDYEYCLVVDGEWMPDPLTQKTVPNPFGGTNSLLTIANSQPSHKRAVTPIGQP